MASATTDLTTCPICLDVFDNTKSLPCLHAFCLKCLQGQFKDNCPGDEALCPMCRKEFEIPPDGLGGLQRDLFIQRLVDVRRELSEVPCVVCLDESDESSEEIATAIMYCVDCKQKLCERCSRPHRRMPAGAHQLKPLGAELKQELLQLRGCSCEKHKDEQMKLYCHQCNENICVLCHAVKHRQHKCGEMPGVAEVFKQEIDKNDQQIASNISALRQQSERIEQDLSKFQSDVDNVKKSAMEIGDGVEGAVDNQITELVSELQSVKSNDTKQARDVQDRLKLVLVSMESFHAYSRELLEKGQPIDVTRAACRLHDRATELLQNDVTTFNFRPRHVTYTPVDVTQLTGLNLVGNLTISSENETDSGTERPSVLRFETEREKEVCQQLNQARDELRQAAETERELQMQLARMQLEMEYHDMGRVIQTLPDGDHILAVTLLGKMLYVLRGESGSSRQIEVYDTDSYCLRHYLTVPGLGWGSDMVACSHNRCAYIPDYSHKSVHRLALPSASTTTWPVDDVPACLSLTYKHTVLVTCDEVRKIKEFSTDGKLLRQLQLQQHIASPWHTIQLPSGQFIVCHGGSNDPVHRVCLIHSDRQLVNSFGGLKGSGSEQMKMPCHLAVDRNGFVFVADSNSRRVLLLSPSLTYIREVVSSDQLKGRPVRLCLDAEKSRLYVAVSYYKGGRVAVVRV